MTDEMTTTTTTDPTSATEATALVAALPRHEHPEVFVATSPQGIIAEQARLRDWATDKKLEAQREYADLCRGKREATAQKWGTKAFQRPISLARGRVVYYEKLEAALKLGYLLIPNFDEVRLLAVRVDPEKTAPYALPLRGTSANDHPDTTPDLLSVGAGEYVADKPVVRRADHTYKDSKGEWQTEVRTKATGYKLVPELPFVLTRPALMSAAAEAMSLKVFDQIGVAGIAARRVSRADPMIVGEILPPQPFGRWNAHKRQRRVTFFVAWYVETRMLEA